MRQTIERQGPITDEYLADPEQVCARLNELRSTEIVSYLQYKQHAYMAVSMVGQAVVGEFVEHANEELVHADRLARRIQALGGVPVFDPEEIARYVDKMKISPAMGSSLKEMVQEDLDLERRQVQVYTSFIREIGDTDVVTRRLLEDILEATEDHATEMHDLLQTHPASGNE
jgi:bacterioferritin